VEWGWAALVRADGLLRGMLCEELDDEDKVEAAGDDEEEGQDEDVSGGGVGSFSGDDRSGPGVDGRLTEGMKGRQSHAQAEASWSWIG
jgi:hypothetical protein